jgi:F-type H+-transporting ATPase subunit a
MTGYFASLFANLNSAENISHEAADTLTHAAGQAADTLAHAAEHGAGTAAEHTPEFPNLIEILNHYFHSDITQFLFDFRIVVYSLVVAIFLSLLAYAGYRRRSLIPGPAQNLMEWIVEMLANMVVSILGEQGRKFVPFLGTLFIYIFCMNLLGLIPGMFSSTAKLNTTLALAICVFLYVQFTGIRNFGIFGYVYHLAGSPKSVVEWCLVPLNLPLHIIGELAKPVSLSLRLFGNISGEDMLLAIFATLGVTILSFIPIPVGLPLHLPFIFLAMLTSFVQALVFALLATIYFSLMSHHEEENH